MQNEPYAPIHISGVTQESARSVIEGSAEEIVAADARLLAESIATHGTDDSVEDAADEGGTGEESEAR